VIFLTNGSLNGLKGLGYPISNEQEIVDGSNVVKFQNFIKNQQKGAIYLVNGSANGIHGDIYENWIDYNRHLTLGYPIDDEKSVENSTDKFSNFQHGKLYWNASTSVVTCHGKCN